MCFSEIATLSLMADFFIIKIIIIIKFKVRASEEFIEIICVTFYAGIVCIYERVMP